jgi:phage terminase large subunit-like protein
MNYESLLNCNPKAELARRNFQDFVLYCFDNYEMKWFHSYICKKLTEFSEGKIKKLMVFMPPQHGKSQLTTRLFPAYLLGKYPNKKIVVSSYNATLASRFNRDIQRVIDDKKYHDVFPKTVLNESNVVTISESYLRNSEIFEIVGFNGFLKTVGRGGALTGTPVDIGIIDDPIKDRAEAMSETIRETLWSWYQDVFETRLHNDSQQLLIQTRWHEEDLAGKLLKRDNDWEIIILEAIKENDKDYDPREIGDVLWDEKHSLERILKVKETSPLTFNSLYQQDPKPTDDMGLLWTKNLLEKYRIHNIPENIKKVISIDPAVTSSAKSDETGLIVVGKDSNDRGYVIEDASGRYSPEQWGKLASELMIKHDADYYVAEKNQGGDMVNTVIRQFDKKNYIKLVTATKGKYVRAEPIYSLYQQGKIFHVGNFILLENQMVTFNPDKNDKSPDRVDALVWGFTELMLGKVYDLRF